MVGLGDLPGGGFESAARGISSDGAVIVGYGTFGSGALDRQAFRWTQGTGMVSLGSLQGSAGYSMAMSVSADGNKVAGTSGSTWGYQAFLWTQATGMVGLGDLAGGSYRSHGNGISPDGTVVVGLSSSTNSTASSWEARPTLARMARWCRW